MIRIPLPIYIVCVRACACEFEFACVCVRVLASAHVCIGVYIFLSLFPLSPPLPYPFSALPINTPRGSSPRKIRCMTVSRKFAISSPGRKRWRNSTPSCSTRRSRPTPWTLSGGTCKTPSSNSKADAEIYMYIYICTRARMPPVLAHAKCESAQRRQGYLR